VALSFSMLSAVLLLPFTLNRLWQGSHALAAVMALHVVLNAVGHPQRALVQQTVTDPLTGAFNRGHFDARLAELRAPLPGADAVNVLLAVDVDHFKAINDRHGHGAGDAVLQGVVGVLNARKRPSDSVFRTGGEERSGRNRVVLAA
jgi:GGDEF domain-containing protein